MRFARLCLIFLISCQLRGQNPWGKQPAPGWWLSLHSPYLDVPTVIAQAVPNPVPVSPGATASFSPQGAAELKILVGKVIPGVGIYDIVVCSPLQIPVAVGSIYQTAVTHGISPLGPGQAKVLFEQTASRSRGSILLEIGADAAIALPVLGQSGLVSMSSKYVVGLLAGHVLFDSIQNQIRARIPDPSSVVNLLLDPAGIITFPGGACKEGMMVARYIGKAQPRGTFSVR